MNMADPLHLRFSLQRGEFHLSADLDVGPGEILGLIGPNGAGKSSLLGAITGDLRITSGEISAGRSVLARRVSGVPEIHLPKPRRSIAHLSQRPRLFPHLTARDNVSFGPRSRGVHRQRANHIAEDWIARVGLGGREHARPLELSGGQQQRIAIARTLAAAPSAVLLDEPFAALDVESAFAIRSLVGAELRALNVPVILVSHDPVDLLALADRVAVLESGVLQQLGPISEVLGSPATPFSARFAGRVLLEGVATGQNTLRLEDGPMTELRGIGTLPGENTPARATYDPRAVRIIPADGIPQRSAEFRDGHYRWVDRISRITPTSSGIAITGARWPRFTAEMPLSAAVTEHLQVGLLIAFELGITGVRFVPVPTPSMQ